MNDNTSIADFPMPGVYLHGQGPAVLLLHSSLSSARQWQPLCQALMADYRCINVDLYGYGQAPLPGDISPFSLAAEVQRIDAILTQQSVSQVYIFGHSYGAATALKFASLHPEKVRGMSLFEPVAFHLLDAGHPTRVMVQQFGQQLTELPAFEAAQLFVDYWNGKGYFTSLPQPVQALMTSQVAKVHLDFIALLGDTARLEDYANIRQPVQILCGEQTRKSSRDVSNALSAVLPDCQFNTTPGGHMAPISHADEINRYFLGGIRSLT